METGGGGYFATKCSWKCQRSLSSRVPGRYGRCTSDNSFFFSKSCLIRIVLILRATAMKQCGSTKAEQPEPGSVRCPLLQRRN